MKKLVLTVLIGSMFCTPMVISQTSGFSQRGKVTLGLRADGLFIGHSSLPLRSKAMMVNPLTGKEVEVTVMRNIPASTDRIADISLSVWQELGLAPEQDVRIYTSAAPRPQAAALPANTPQEPAVDPQEEAAQIAQAEPSGQAPYPSGMSSGQAPSGSSYPSGASGFDNLPPGVKFENNNNFIINGFPGAMPDSAMPAAGYGTQGQAQPSAGYGTQGQAAQPAVGYGTRTQTGQSGAVNDAWAHPAQSGAGYGTQGQAAQPAAGYGTQAQTTQSAAVNDAWARPAQSAAVNDTWARPAQSSAGYGTQAQTTQPVAATDPWAWAAQPAANDTRAQAAQPPAAIDTWARPAQAVPSAQTRPQQPASAIEPRTQQAPAIPASMPASASGTQTQQAPAKNPPPAPKPAVATPPSRPQRPGLIIETTPQTANSAVIIDAPKAAQIIELTTPQEFPGLPALPAIWE